MKQKIIIFFVLFCLFCINGIVLAEVEKPLLGVHWSYTPMFDFVEDAPGILWSNENKIVISVNEYFREGTTLESAVANWNEVNKGLTVTKTIYWIHDGMKAIVLRASYIDKAYEFLIYFIETPNSITEISVSGRDNFSQYEEDLQKMIKTFKWHEDLSMSGLPYTLDLPEGWKLARVDRQVDYFSLNGKDPWIEKVPFICVYYVKEDATDSDLSIRLNHSLMPDYTKYEIEVLEDVQIDGWPARIWYFSVFDEKESQTIHMMACRIATDKFIYNFEVAESEVMTREIFKNVVMSWKFIGNTEIRLFN